MQMSESINELAAALAKAQGQITGALKESANPFFKSRYADLSSCWDACRKQLSENGLAVVQTTVNSELGTELITVLAHASGQWIRGSLLVRAKDDSAQAQGSGLTYARRYALAAIVGLAQIDDDGEAAQPRPSQVRSTESKKAKSHAARIVDAVAASKDALVLELWDEAAQNHEFAASVWAGLPRTVKHKIQDLRKTP